MKILICGGRNLNEGEVANYLAIMLAYVRITKIIHGNAPGADKGGERFAKAYSIPFEVFQADWGNLEAIPCKVKQGKQGPYNALAGFNRNKQMLDEGKPDLVVAFPGGPGTRNMILQSEKANVPVIVIPEIYTPFFSKKGDLNDSF